LKILQYQAAGVPVVCSPVGANLEIVEPEVTGLFATGEAEWTQAMVRLLQDRERGRRFAAAGRARVEAVYSADRIGARLADALATLKTPAGRKRGRDAVVAGSGGDDAGRKPGERRNKPEEHERLLVADHLRERPAVLAARVRPK